jgi:hypothetical protein
MKARLDRDRRKGHRGKSQEISEKLAAYGLSAMRPMESQAVAGVSGHEGGTAFALLCAASMRRCPRRPLGLDERECEVKGQHYREDCREKDGGGITKSDQLFPTRCQGHSQPLTAKTSQ